MLFFCVGGEKVSAKQSCTFFTVLHVLCNFFRDWAVVPGDWSLVMQGMLTCVLTGALTYILASMA